jgi:hypothetical protein
MMPPKLSYLPLVQADGSGRFGNMLAAAIAQLLEQEG